MGLARKDEFFLICTVEQMISKKEYEDAKKYDLAKDFQARQDVEVQQHGFLYYTVYNEAINIVAKQQAKEDGVSDADYKIKKMYKTATLNKRKLRCKIKA